MAWPRGLKRKGFKDSGMKMREWAQSQGFRLPEAPPEPVPSLPENKSVDSPLEGEVALPGGGVGRWSVQKDEWARQTIYIKTENGDIVFRERRNRTDVDAQVQDMLGRK